MPGCGVTGRQLTSVSFISSRFVGGCKALCALKRRHSLIIIVCIQADKVRRDEEPKDAPNSTNLDNPTAGDAKRDG